MDSNGKRLSRDARDEHHEPLRSVVLGIVVGVYLLGLGGLVGTALERMRFNYHREAIVARYNGLLRARNSTLMSIEREIAQESRTSAAPERVNVVRED